MGGACDHVSVTNRLQLPHGRGLREKDYHIVFVVTLYLDTIVSKEFVVATFETKVFLLFVIFISGQYAY